MEPISVQIIDLSHAQDSIEAMENPATWGFDMKKMTGV
jgi:hypothetical protein